MYRLLFDRDVADWVSDQIWGAPEFENHQAIGVLRGSELVGGVVYHNYREHDIELSCAATDPRWLSRGRLSVLFGYPFIQLGCLRVTAVAARSNKRARRMNERLGFKLEGCARKAWEGKDAMLYGMLREECRWLRYPNGKEESQDSKAA